MCSSAAEHFFYTEACGGSSPLTPTQEVRAYSLTVKATVLYLQCADISCMKKCTKCVVRCANCHRKKTSDDFNWWKSSYSTTADS